MIKTALDIFKFIPNRVSAAISALLMLVFSSSNVWAYAAPPGPGCTTTNAGALDITCSDNASCSRSANFLAGETVTFSVAIANGPFTLSTGATTITAGATASFTASFVIPSDGNYIFSYDNTANPTAAPITATCTPAGSRNSSDIIKHQVTNHLASILGLYGEHRSPLLYHSENKDDVFQDGSGVIPSIQTSENSFTFNSSLRDLQTLARNNDPYSDSTTPQPQRWDLWLKGRYSDYRNDDSATDGYAALVNLGVDYEVSEKLLVGLMGGFDWGSQTSSSINATTDIDGFIFGPYASLRLTDELSLYGRAAWGRADYDFKQGTVTGQTSSERLMLNASLKGTYWSQYPLRLTPDISLQYARETLDAYTNSANNVVNATTVELGQLRFGGEIGNRMTLDNGYLFDPFVSLHGVWDFTNEGNLTIATNLNAQMSDIRARAGIGFNLQTATNAHLNVALHYEGLGSADFSALSGTVRLVIPLD